MCIPSKSLTISPIPESNFSWHHEDTRSSPSLSLQELNKSTEVSSPALLAADANEYFRARPSEKKTRQLAGYEQEAEEDEEKKGSDDERLLRGNHLAFDGHHVLISALKDCAVQRDVHRGRISHIEAVKKGLCESRNFVGNTLVHMYGECGMLAEAEDVFQSLPFRTVVAWTALIAGYAQQGHGEAALMRFEEMQHENLSPNRATYLSILQACANLRAPDKCRDIHLRIAEDGLENDTSIGTALVAMYGKCGWFEKAQEVFDKISVRNVVSFGALLSAFVQHGLYEEAFRCFEQMEHEGVVPNAITCISLLKACGSLEAINEGFQVHMKAVKVGFLDDDDATLGNALLDMYAKCAALIEAQHVFGAHQLCDVVSWNSLITGYSQYGDGEEVIILFEEMQKKGFSPGIVTYIAVLKACGRLDEAFKGLQVHAETCKKGISDEMLVGAAIVEMYSNFGLLIEAQNIFDSVSPKSLVLWNVLIAAYVQHGHSKEASVCFDEMQSEGLSPNLLTLTTILKAYTSLNAAQKGQDLLFQFEQKGLLALDMVARTMLIHMYGKCGFIDHAQKIFDELSVQDLVSWSALIKGYADKGLGEEALECYEKMQLVGLSPNLVTFIGILKACGSIGAAIYGREIHSVIIKKTLLENDILVGTSLVDMYGQCGLVTEASEVFHKLPRHNTISWNALLAAYSQIGDVQNVFKCYDAMVAEGLRPSIATFTIVFSTCSHAGLLDIGQLYFEVMKISHGLLPTVEHYNCLIDLFGRAGQVEKTLMMIPQMPIIATPTTWHTVLAACERYDTNYEAFVYLSKLAAL